MKIRKKYDLIDPNRFEKNRIQYLVNNLTIS